MTMLKVTERLSIGITIDHLELDLTKFKVLFLQLVASTNYHLPFGRLQLSDLYGYFQKYPLGDNQTIKIDILTENSTNKPVTTSYSMRIFNAPHKSQGSAVVYDMILIYDAPRFTHESNSESFGNVSSRTALSIVAENCGLDFYSNVATADNQVWRGHSDRYCAIVRTIASAGYVDNNSCMVPCVSLDGTLNYVDVSRLDYAKPTTTFTNTQSGDLNSYTTVGKIVEHLKAGVSNTLNGYKLKTHAQIPLEAESSNFPSFSSVLSTTASSSINYNKNIGSAIASGRVVYAPINCGNVHPNYEKAIHQNQRLRALFGTGLDVCVAGPTQANLLSVAGLNIYSMQGSDRVLNSTLSGAYLILGKGVFVTASGNYYEKFLLVRQGKNNIQSSSQAT